jgi:pilus assembly protein CpaB
MNRRAFLVSLVLALAGATLLLLYMRQYERQMSGGEQVQLLTAVKPIKAGAPITEDMLTTRGVPLAYVDDRAVKATERQKVLGLMTSNALQPQQTLMWTDLAIMTEERDLSSLVQPGKRAVTVSAATGGDNRGNALIHPGDYVDVIVTMLDTSSPSEEAKGQRSVVLLQKVLVLAVGLDTQSATFSDPKKKDSPFAHRDKLLTLSLNLQEAQLLGLATQKGRISVAVRNAMDSRVASEAPDMNESALLDSRARAEAQRPVRALSANVNHPVKIEGPKRR